MTGGGGNGERRKEENVHEICICLLFDIMNANAKIMLDFKRNTIIGKMTILILSFLITFIK